MWRQGMIRRSNTPDPIELASMVKEMASYGRNTRSTDPIELASMVKEMVGRRRRVVRRANLIHHPGKLDGVFSWRGECVLAHHLVHQSAQGGWGPKTMGRHALHRVTWLRPFRADEMVWWVRTQGCALGFRIRPLGGRRPVIRFACVARSRNAASFDSPGRSPGNHRPFIPSLAPTGRHPSGRAARSCLVPTLDRPIGGHQMQIAGRVEHSIDVACPPPSRDTGIQPSGDLHG